MDMPEEWRDIPGYDTYQVSSLGNIRNKKTLYVLNGSIDRYGYKKFYAWSTKEKPKTLKFHKAVHFAFFTGLEGVVNHKDGDRTNNKVSNLEIVNIRENATHSRMAKAPNTGASFHKPSGGWTSRISINGVRKHLGTFKTPEEAGARYRKELLDLGLENKYVKNAPPQAQEE